MMTIRTMRDWLRGAVPSSAYRHIRYCWWYSHYYLPLRITAGFESQKPRVHSFPAQPLTLVPKIESVNVRRPTRMCRIMTRHGSDKGQGWHNYTAIYNALFRRLRDRPLRILELGLGTNNPDLVSTMGAFGTPGASLRGWREIFKRAPTIYGADIDRSILFEEERIRTFYCDQLDKQSIADLWSQPGLKDGADIIIDDGLHTFAGNISFLEASLPRLRPDGYYIVEDIIVDTLPEWLHTLKSDYQTKFHEHECGLVELPNPQNAFDNNLLIIWRRPT